MMQKIKFLTAGESHGKGLLGIIEGIPAGLEVDEEYIAVQLKRRQLGYGRGKRMKIESDRAEIYAGVRHGKTLGSPVGLIIRNKDWENWEKKMSVLPTDSPGAPVTVPRPGHADLAGVQKFDLTDIRDVLERSSARETAMRVALAAICRKLLETFNIHVGSRVIQIHSAVDGKAIDNEISGAELNHMADKSPVRCINPQAEYQMIQAIDSAIRHGDSVGGVMQIIATGLPYGLGTHSRWDGKLQARLAESLLSVNAFKGVEIGAGFDSASRYGSEVHDEIGWDGKQYIRYSNRAGGIEGGMSNGQPLDIRVVMKPIPTLIKPLRSVDILTKEKKDAHKERTDTCAVPAASIVAEGMVALVLADALLEKFGGDTVDQLARHLKASGKW